MPKINLKDNIWIEGIINDGIFRLLPTGKTTLYQGKTSEISEELAKNIVETIPLMFEDMRVVDNHGNDVVFKNYITNEFVKRSGKRSIQSACPEEYCIIYKEN